MIENIRPLTSPEAHWLKHILFNKEFGLFDHTDKALTLQNPLAVIRAFPKENHLATSTMFDVAARYRENRIYERFKIDFEQYLSLPRPRSMLYDRIAREYFHDAEERERQEAKAIEDQIREAHKDK